MTRIAWVSGRDYRFNGGAERADLAMIRLAPGEVDILAPGSVNDLGRYDKVVVSTLRNLNRVELVGVARERAAYWVHDMEFTGHWLYNTADPFIALTPQHLRREKVTSYRTLVNPGHFDTTGMEPSTEKGDWALWAHRPVREKGLDRAQSWAAARGVDLIVKSGAPHEEVIWAMKSARYFVVLSREFDPGPGSVIEAQLCGCDLVVDNVGYFDEPRDVLKERIDRAAEEFWHEVLR